MRRFTLGELCEFVRGVSPTLKTEPGPFPLVVTAGYRRSSAEWQVEGPAVCIPLISSTGHGDAAIHRVHYQEGRFALANLMVALLPRSPGACDAKYLYFLLSAKKDQLLVPLMLGTANVSLKERDIAGVEVSLPPLPEQRRVVGWIEDVAGLAGKARGIREAQQADIGKLLSAAFWNTAASAPRARMRDVAPLTRRAVTIEPTGQYPELGIRSFGKGTFHKPALSGLELGGKRIFRIERGDLLFSNVFAWEGAVAVATASDEGRYGSHRFMTCVPIPAVATANYLRFFFLTAEGLDLLQSASPGGAGRNRTLGVEALQEILVPIPPVAEQSRFDTLFKEVVELQRSQQEVDGSLDALLPAVLDRAFRGEL